MGKLVSDAVDKPNPDKFKRDKSYLFTKVVIRRLPPALTKDEFLSEVGELPEHDYFRFVAADFTFGNVGFTRAYINFKEYLDVLDFRNKYDGYIFHDSKGHENSAVVELAPCQMIPKDRKKKDHKCGLIDKDPDYMQFLEQLEKEEEKLPSAEVYIEEIEAQKAIDKNKEKVVTPLIEFLQEKRDNRIAARQAAIAQREKEKLARIEKEKEKRKEREEKEKERRAKLEEKKESRRTDAAPQRKSPEKSYRESRKFGGEFKKDNSAANGTSSEKRTNEEKPRDERGDDKTEKTKEPSDKGRDKGKDVDKRKPAEREKFSYDRDKSYKDKDKDRESESEKDYRGKDRDRDREREKDNQDDKENERESYRDKKTSRLKEKPFDRDKERYDREKDRPADRYKGNRYNDRDKGGRYNKDFYDKERYPDKDRYNEKDRNRYNSDREKDSLKDRGKDKKTDYLNDKSSNDFKSSKDNDREKFKKEKESSGKEKISESKLEGEKGEKGMKSENSKPTLDRRPSVEHEDPSIVSVTETKEAKKENPGSGRSSPDKSSRKPRPEMKIYRPPSERSLTSSDKRFYEKKSSDSSSGSGKYNSREKYDYDDRSSDRERDREKSRPSSRSSANRDRYRDTDDKAYSSNRYNNRDNNRRFDNRDHGDGYENRRKPQERRINRYDREKENRYERERENSKRFGGESEKVERSEDKINRLTEKLLEKSSLKTPAEKSEIDKEKEAEQERYRRNWLGKD